MTGMRMPQQKQDSRLWLAFANSQGLANTAFFFLVAHSLTVQHQAQGYVQGGETQRLPLWEITSRAVALD